MNRDTRRPVSGATFAIGGLFAVMVLAACGGGAEATTNSVASLADVAESSAVAVEAPTDATATDAAATDATLTADEAALEFSQCMRDENLDFPDVGVDAEGNPDLRSSIEDAGLDPRSTEFRTAMQTCREILQASGFGGGGRAALADDPAVQDAFVAYSECLRDEGLDVGDLQLGGGPGAGQGGQGANAQGAQGTDAPDAQAQGEAGADGERPPRGQGQGQGGFANRGNRIANQLGLDAEDPEVAAALDTCGPILDGALGQLGRGPGNNG